LRIGSQPPEAEFAAGPGRSLSPGRPTGSGLRPARWASCGRQGRRWQTPR